MRLLNRVGLNYAIGGYKYQPESLTLFSALSGTYSTARKIEMDKMIKSLKTAGIWAKLDVLQMYAAPTATDAVVNWKSPGTFNATLVNSPTLEADRGITGNGSSSYINSGYIPSTGGNQYTRNNASYGGYFRSLTNAAKDDIGVTDPTNVIDMLIGTNFYQRINSVTGVSTILTIARAVGLWGHNRSAANANEIIINSNRQTDTAASSGVPSKVMYVCAFNSNGTAAGFATNQVSLFFAGSNISAEWASFLTAIETYLDYIGAGVI